MRLKWLQYDRDDSVIVHGHWSVRWEANVTSGYSGLSHRQQNLITIITTYYYYLTALTWHRNILQVSFEIHWKCFLKEFELIRYNDFATCDWITTATYLYPYALTHVIVMLIPYMHIIIFQVLILKCQM